MSPPIVLPDEVEDLIIKNYLSGSSERKLCREFQVSRAYLDGLLLRKGTSRRKRKNSKSDGKTTNQRSYERILSDPKLLSSYNQKKYFNRVWRKYGLSEQGFSVIYASQRGECPICFKSLLWKLDGSPDFHIDHCHKTQEVRGILCSVCNTSMGRLGDDKHRIRRMWNYLEWSEC